MRGQGGQGMECERGTGRTGDGGSVREDRGWRGSVREDRDGGSVRGDREDRGWRECERGQGMEGV